MVRSARYLVGQNGVPWPPLELARPWQSLGPHSELGHGHSCRPHAHQAVCSPESAQSPCAPAPVSAIGPRTSFLRTSAPHHGHPPPARASASRTRLRPGRLPFSALPRPPPPGSVPRALFPPPLALLCPSVPCVWVPPAPRARVLPDVRRHRPAGGWARTAGGEQPRLLLAGGNAKPAPLHKSRCSLGRKAVKL